LVTTIPRPESSIIQVAAINLVPDDSNNRADRSSGSVSANGVNRRRILCVSGASTAAVLGGCLDSTGSDTVDPGRDEATPTNVADSTDDLAYDLLSFDEFGAELETTFTRIPHLDQPPVDGGGWGPAPTIEIPQGDVQ
jgi:hypothetical protein